LPATLQRVPDPPLDDNTEALERAIRRAVETMDLAPLAATLHGLVRGEVDAALAPLAGAGAAGGEQMLTVEDCAREAGVCAATVYRLLRSGRLRGQKLGRGWRVKRSNLEALLTEPVLRPASHDIPGTARRPAARRRAPGPGVGEDFVEMVRRHQAEGRVVRAGSNGR